jgi:polyisoprenoid-binding protein YceI
VRARWTAVLALPALGFALYLGAPTAVTYRIIPGRGSIHVRVPTEGLNVKARAIVLNAKEYRGTIVYDPVHPEKATVELKVNVRGLEPTSPRFTFRDTNLLLLYLRSRWVLDMVRWPEISFIGSGARFGGERGSGYYAVSVPGKLEIKGRLALVQLDAIASVGTEGIRVFGRHFVRQRDHGIVPLRDRTGAYTLRNELEVSFDIFAAPSYERPLDEDEVKPPEWKERARDSGTLKIPEPSDEPPR